MEIGNLKVKEQNRILKAQLELIWFHLVRMESYLDLSYADTESAEYNQGFNEATDLTCKLVGELINRINLS